MVATQKSFNPIDQQRQVLADVMRSAVKWYGLPANPARGVEMPRIKPVRPRWALTVPQAAALGPLVVEGARHVIARAYNGAPSRRVVRAAVEECQRKGRYAGHNN